MKLKGKRVCIFVEYNYEDLEVHYPLIRLQEEGANVITVGVYRKKKLIFVGPKAGVKYTGKHGYPVVSDKDIASVSTKDFDALVIPGGWAPDYWRRDERFVKFVQDMHKEGKPVAAICHGPWMLCSARIVKDVNVTSFCSIKDDLINAGAEWVDAEVVEDKGIITSRTPKDLIPFCKTIIAALSK